MILNIYYFNILHCFCIYKNTHIGGRTCHHSRSLIDAAKQIYHIGGCRTSSLNICTGNNICVQLLMSVNVHVVQSPLQPSPLSAPLDSLLASLGQVGQDLLNWPLSHPDMSSSSQLELYLVFEALESNIRQKSKLIPDPAERDFQDIWQGWAGQILVLLSCMWRSWQHQTVPVDHSALTKVPKLQLLTCSLLNSEIDTC